ncbi:MAG TPA: phosphopentomutase [Vicinamibacterales bacterium]
MAEPGIPASGADRSARLLARAIVIVLDSVGVGELPDAAAYGDQGSNTVGNLSAHVHLQLPALSSLGLTRIVDVRHHAPPVMPLAAYGRMREQSPGKDSVTGHWELMGLVLDRAFPTFPNGFPPEIIAEIERRTGRGLMGNIVGSGTEIMDRLGAEHMRTGRPIVYTSADSVFQVLAHEEVVPVEELYAICREAYGVVVEGLGVGRVIARPFVGAPGSFRRTANRHDFAMPPRGETLLDRLTASGIEVHAIGKITDLFAGRGITTSVHTASDDEAMDAVEAEVRRGRDGLVFANLVDFDTVYGHRNDVQGYARNLERFDHRLADLLPLLAPSDLLVITADHGNDPTTPSTDHSREYVPLLVMGAGARPGVPLGERATFADLAQTLAELFGVGPMAHGTSFRRELFG